jgi:DNA-directed RNA polymerase subunit RPC12/RpoP
MTTPADSQPSALVRRLQEQPSSFKVMNTTPVPYICGWCGKENEFKAKDQLRCLKCGYRVFYKKRLAEGMQYEAR